MNQSYIPFTLPGLKISGTSITNEKLIICTQATRQAARCPDCKQLSTRRHSSYTRTVKDLPVGLDQVELHIQTRRFRCISASCPRCTFAEQHPEIVLRRGRRTKRLTANLIQIGLALGGQAGARLAGKLQMAVSGATILRLVRQVSLPPVEKPRIIGIDDWALRKGRTYGTIVVDLESHQPIDLLPSREGSVVKEWFQGHPTVEIVTRDRSGEYKEAITQGAPKAKQIADRWHLLHNLAESIVRHLSRRYDAICRLAPLVAEGNPPETLAKRRRYYRGRGCSELQAARAKQREERFRSVKARHAQGVYTSDIAKEFNLSRQTVSHWVNSDSLPPDARGRFKRVCLIDPYEPYLRKRLAEGCTNQSQLWREICQQGFTGDRSLVSRWVRHQELPLKRSATKPKRVPMPRPRPLAWLLLRTDEEHNEEERQVWQWLRQYKLLVELRDLAHEFRAIVRERQGEVWPSWLERCTTCSVKELRNLAIGFKRDEAAVGEAVTEIWSNGQVEGQINRLKYLKRQMYGRANFDLLRLRFLVT